MGLRGIGRNPWSHGVVEGRLVPCARERRLAR